MKEGKGELFARDDIYIDYPFEEVMFRWDHGAKKVYRRFYGEEECPDSVAHDNRLFNDAIQFGDQITRKQYERGAVRK
jgi:hypothetical protein